MFDKPNTTPFPDELIDRDLKNLSGSETKIIAVIIRKTFGFHKAWDFISLSQIKEITGLKATAIITATTRLEDDGFIKSAYVCPKCDLIVKYKPPEKRTQERTYTCPSCKTKESPNKWYALNISGEDMEKYLQETLKIKQNDPNKKGSQKIRLPHQPEVVRKSDYGSQKIRLPRNFVENNVLDNDTNDLHENNDQGGSHIFRYTTNNTTNNIQETFKSSLSNNIDPINGESKNEKSESELDNEIALKEDEADHLQYGRKLIEEIYPFYFARNQGGEMNEVKKKMVIEIGYFLEMDEDLMRKCITDVASRIKEPANLLAWAIEAFKEEQGWEQNGRQRKH